MVWSIVQDADSYEIYYNTTNNFNEEKTFEDTTETSYTTTEIKTNKITYYFWVRAKTADGLKSDLSNSVSCYVENEEESEETLAAPSYLNATAMSESSVSLNWENVTGATYYLVYYSRYNSVSYATDYVIAYTNYITIPQLISGTAYYFWVKASNGTTQSTYSPYAAAMTKDKQEVIVDLVTPCLFRNVEYTDDGKGFAIKLITSDDYIDSRTQKYRLYRSESKYDGYEQVKEINASSALIFEDNSVKIEMNRYYYYKVSAVCGASEKFSEKGLSVTLEAPYVYASCNESWGGYISFDGGTNKQKVTIKEDKSGNFNIDILTLYNAGTYPIWIKRNNKNANEYPEYNFLPSGSYKISIKNGNVTFLKYIKSGAAKLFDL